MASEQLTIEIKYEDHGAKGKIDDLTSSVNALNAATTGKGFKSLGHVAKNLATIANSASGLGDIGRKLNELAVGSTKVFDAFRSFDPKSYSNNIKSLTTAINSISNAVGNLSQKGSGLKAVADALKQLPSAANTNRGSSLSGMQTSAKSATAVFKALGNDIKKVINLSWRLGKLPFKMILTPIANIGKGLKNMTTKFGSFLSGIGRIALYRAIRTGIKLVTSAVKDGVNHLYVWAGMVGNSFKPTMDSLATSFMYLKNSIGAAVSPILDALAPAFEALINQIVDVLNIFNQVIATMTGASTWRKALRAAASYSDNIGNLGHEAEDSADAVKELKRTILGFDEINKLEDKMETLSPKKNGKDATGMYDTQGAFSFVEVPIGKTALDIANKLKEAWEKGDFTSIGTMIGQKIGNALLGVKWDDEIKPTVKKLATSFGTLLNGMFDYTGPGGRALWDGIAYTIYNAINTAILGYVTFFDTVHWEGIGEGIGAALRQVLQNLDWNGMASALAAFPNAVIKTVTGFTKQFTYKDFAEAGANIGRTISSALVQIDWKGLFGNAVKIATGLLAALNSALTSFDWTSVKGAILGGIKVIKPQEWKNLGKEIAQAVINVAGFGINLLNTVTTFLATGIDWKNLKQGIVDGVNKVPKATWANMGKAIGRTIFNVAVFVANLVDSMVKFIKNGGWGDLVKGIKDGITKGMKQYGGWTGVSKMLGKWIVDNIGTISALLAIAIGIKSLKNIAGALLTGKLFASMVTSAPLIGGGTLASLGTLPAFLAACAIAVPIAVSVTPVVMEKVDELVQDFVDAMDPVVNPAVDKVVEIITNRNYKPNHIYTGGATAGEKGAPSSTTYKRDLGNGGSVWQMPSGDLNLPNIDLDKALEAARKRAQKVVATIVTQESERLKSADTNAPQFKFTATIDTTKLPTEWQKLANAWSILSKNNKVAKFITEGLRNDGKTWWELLKEYWGTETKSKKAQRFTTEGIFNKASEWWTQVTGFWSSFTTGKKASRFTIEGIFNQATQWWTQVTGFWKSYITGKNASRFTTEGVQNKASTWWSQLTGFWNAIVGPNHASRFKTEGVVDQSSSWWGQVLGFWNVAIAGVTASPFTIAGVVNTAWEWWQQTEDYWNQATGYSNLSASVEIGNAYNAFVSAFNNMQTYFNNNHLTAFVDTASTGTTAGGSVTGALTPSSSSSRNSSGSLNLGDDAINAFANTAGKKTTTTKKKKKATGGIYKNGAWHDITAFAAGGFPSGEMFIAREAGPELVGTIGGNTAVMNNDQIVASVSAGVAQAVSGVMGGGNVNEITIKIDSETLYRMVKKGERKASGRYGTAIAIG